VNIGILDDSVSILDFLETTLSMDGHLVFRHTTGASLLNAIFPPSTSAESRARYDLIILDLLLPGDLSGVDVFVSIRKAFDVEDLPIIVITAVDEHTLAQFRHILPDDVPIVRKPFHPRHIRQLVSQMMIADRSRW
jgi:DNA-binding response OmpR family regulator